MPEINETKLLLFFISQISVRTFDRIQIYFQEKCYSPKHVFTAIQFKNPHCVLISERNLLLCLPKVKKTGQKTKFVFSHTCFVTIQTKSLSQCIFSWAALFLLEICQTHNVPGILYFLLLPESQRNPDGLESYAHHCYSL